MSFRLRYWCILTVLNVILSLVHAAKGSNYAFVALGLTGLSGYMVTRLLNLEKDGGENDNNGSNNE